MAGHHKHPPSSCPRGRAKETAKKGVHGAVGRPEGRKGVGGGWGRVERWRSAYAPFRPSLAEPRPRSRRPASWASSADFPRPRPLPAELKSAGERARRARRGAVPERPSVAGAQDGPEARSGHGTRPRRGGPDEGGWRGEGACLPASRRTPGRLRGGWRDGTDPGHSLTQTAPRGGRKL